MSATKGSRDTQGHIIALRRLRPLVSPRIRVVNCRYLATVDNGPSRCTKLKVTSLERPSGAGVEFVFFAILLSSIRWGGELPPSREKRRGSKEPPERGEREGAERGTSDELGRSREGVLSPSKSVGEVQRTWRARARRSGEDIPEGLAPTPADPEDLQSTELDVASAEAVAGTGEVHLSKAVRHDG